MVNWLNQLQLVSKSSFPASSSADQGLGKLFMPRIRADWLGCWSQINQHVNLRNMANALLVGGGGGGRVRRCGINTKMEIRAAHQDEPYIKYARRWTRSCTERLILRWSFRYKSDGHIDDGGNRPATA